MTIIKIGDIVEYNWTSWTSWIGRNYTKTGTVVAVQYSLAADAPIRFEVRKSAKTFYPDHVDAGLVNKIGEGKPITKVDILNASRKREQNKIIRRSIPKVMKKPSKSHYICYVLMCAGVPMKRVDIMRRVHLMSGSALAFKPTSNGCYFLTEACSSGHEAAAASLVRRGLIVKSGRVKRYITYALTPAGEMHAKEYIIWKDS